MKGGCFASGCVFALVGIASFGVAVHQLIARLIIYATPSDDFMTQAQAIGWMNAMAVVMVAGIVFLLVMRGRKR